MSHVLIITEKPSASRAVSEALADSGTLKKFGDRAFWYEFMKGNEKYVVAPAVGHLFALKQASKGWTYPVFDVKWIPSFEASKTAEFSRIYYENLTNATKDAKDVIIATDYDDEGEVIGYNILKFICGMKNAQRMKFSTMTHEELIDSFEHPIKLDKKLIEAGITRHMLDWYFGINFTRALTLSIKNASQRFKILSTGRVQGPVLHMLAKHEKKIRAFKSKPFWELKLKLKIGQQEFEADYEKDKLWNKKEAESLRKKADEKSGIVKDITIKIYNQQPPVPYNTTALLADISRYFGYTPQQGLNIAENLYQSGYISYPRTASQQLPANIGYKRILQALSKLPGYQKDANFLLAQNELKPVQGKRTDPAHPAVYHTFQTPKRLGDQQQRVYDLIVRRFMATFGSVAKRESLKIKIDANGVIFFLFGKRTIESGWTQLFGKYSQREEILLPKIEKGDEIKIKKSEIFDKETQPPARYSQGSVLKDMEEKGLGTKATRSQILQTLYNRGYLVGKSIEVTDLGMNISDILEKNVSEIVSERLTRQFEENTDMILKNKKKSEEVLEDAKKVIEKISEEFKKKENKIGQELTKALIDTQEKQSVIGTCPKCNGTLKVHKSWRTGKRFVGCSGYKDGCRFGSPLPPMGRIEAIGKTCDKCKTPIIQIHIPGKRPFRSCVDIECPTKKDWVDKKKLKKIQKESRESSKRAQENKCPDCGKMFNNSRGLAIHKRVHKK